LSISPIYGFIPERSDKTTLKDWVGAPELKKRLMDIISEIVAITPLEFVPACIVIEKDA
jgi:hypothetical protein